MRPGAGRGSSARGIRAASKTVTSPLSRLTTQTLPLPRRLVVWSRSLRPPREWGDGAHRANEYEHEPAHGGTSCGSALGGPADAPAVGLGAERYADAAVNSNTYLARLV